MKNLSRFRPSPAMAVAFIALFVAGAGTATAAKLITGKRIKNSSITTLDVKNRSLLARDFRSGQLPRGRRGPAGPAGRAGQNGVPVLSYRSLAFDVPASDPGGGATTACPAGQYPTGGDAYVLNADGTAAEEQGLIDRQFYFTVPGSPAPNAWRAVTVANDTDANVLVVEAICVQTSAVPTERFDKAKGPAVRELRRR